MLRTFIQVLALTTVLMSSIFLIRGTVILSEKDLAELSMTKCGANLDIAKNLCHQRVDYVIGSALLLLSFFLQLGNMLWEMRICDFAVNRAGLWLGIVATLLLVFTANVMSGWLYNGHYRQVEKLIKKNIEEAEKNCRILPPNK